MAPSTVNLTELCSRYVGMQLAGDRRAALKLIDEALVAGVSVADLSTHVVAAAQREIGRLWQENRISIAQEHMATAISQLALAHVFGHAEFRERVGKKILVACVAGEYHDFPARLFADSLDLAGYEVRFLGANVPPGSLLRMLDEERTDLLGLSVTMLFNLQSLRETVRAVRSDDRRRKLPIAVGGYAVREMARLREDLAVDLVIVNADDCVAQIDELLGVPP